MNNSFQEFKAKIDIVDVISWYINLQKKGKNFWAVCPFHDDTKPSLSISTTKQIYKCFVCGASGDAITFVSNFEKVSYKEAMKKISTKLGIDFHFKSDEFNKPKYNDNQQKIINALNDASNFFQYSLELEDNQEAQKYIEKRKISSNLREKFKIGYAPGKGLIDFLKKKGHDDSTLINASLMNDRGNSFFRNRLIFAISNMHNDVVAFSGRTLKDDVEPKYINSSESALFSKSSIFYNWNNAQESIKHQKSVYITEGFMDVIALERIGISNSLAIMGASFSSQHLALIKQFKVFLMLDSDQAGVNATFKIIKTLLQEKTKVNVIYTQNQKDPDTIFMQKGPEALKKELSLYVSGLEFIYSLLIKKVDPMKIDNINEFITLFVEYLKFSSNIEKDFYAQKISEHLKIDKNLILEKLSFKKKEFRPALKKNPPKKKILKKPELTLEDKKYSHILIRSLIRKSEFAQFIKKDKVIFSSPLYTEIVKSLLELIDDNNKKIHSDLRKKITEINGESDEVVSTENEFKDLINIISAKTNKYFRKKKVRGSVLKLNND